MEDKRKNSSTVEEKNSVKDNHILWVPIGLLLGVAVGSVPAIGMNFGIPVCLGAAALADIIATVIKRRRAD